ncbi:non-heme iron oxygenase ferredoxin subunit [Deinococcus arenicola]|uniref:Non-heme iron oxygenase ferredoxin subunit n=1 Tax=Deinococcus arenicola TaxID=2994950 RepID=A0ABU4DM63_9DEIO|nr:non-heme iron oxygenase ferredoxin subunit [Deinococcus sp. ZS9-10]MDV6373525.1 non-heme iron oxygenase ferredoxin subunit [Deinococcus sp. ZS9-10]
MSVTENSERVRVGLETEMPDGHQTAVAMGAISVLVVNDEGKFYALRNNCTHQDYPLLGGEVSMGRITCQKHGARFELETGKAKSLPAVKPVKLFKTEIEDGVVYVSPL